MTEYRCRACRKLLFRANRLRYAALEAKCTRCGTLGTPEVSGPLQGEYACPRCDVHSFCERPPQNVDFCIRCGVTMPPVTRAPREPALREVKATGAFPLLVPARIKAA